MAKLGRKVSRECGMLSFLDDANIENPSTVIPGRAQRGPGIHNPSA
jgi:hypothetical protein